MAMLQWLSANWCRVVTMRKITLAVLLLAGLAGTAYAQQGKEDPYAAQDAAKARSAAALDKQYQMILQLTDKGTTVKVDPWRNMRGTDASKAKN
jgi:hypothetical protein